MATEGWLEQQINDVLAGRSTELSLGSRELSQLTEVPQQIQGLAGLQSLYLGDAEIMHLPSWLGQLPDLEKIDISLAPVTAPPSYLPNVHWGVSAEQILHSGNQLDPAKIFGLLIRNTTSQRAIRHAFSLTSSGLNLIQIEISTRMLVNDYDPEQVRETWSSLGILNSELDKFLETQTGLRRLALYGCPLGRIPEPILRLRSLTHIALEGIWPTAVPGWLFQIPELTSLELGFNGLSALPDTVSEAKHLEHLGLEYNQFRHIPAGVWELAALKTLDLDACPVEEIPAEILRLERLSRLGLGRLDYSAVPKELVAPPPEIAAQGLDAIKRYWSQERDAGVDYLAEAKLLIVGEPGAGKTSLAKKILDPAYELNAGENSTEGIDVLAWQFPASIRVRDEADEHLIPRDFRVNIWDFGGQEIYHSTHQFFLTKRSIYVLVTDERREDTDFEYWLEIVNLLSDGSPLVIVQNRKQGRQHRSDFGAMRQRYPNLCGTLVVDLADNSGLDTAVEKIRRELEQLPHIGTPLPKTWRAVRLALEANPRNYISAADFFSICRANGFTELQRHAPTGRVPA